jgi:oligosaccharide repeat unit polymerase
VVVYLLIVLLAVITAVSYAVVGRDIIHPGVIVPGVFLISSLCSAVVLRVWEAELHVQTVTTICGGVVLYVLTTWVWTIRSNSQGSELDVAPLPATEAEGSASSGQGEIRVLRSVLVVAMIVSVLVAVVYVRDVLRVVTALGGSGLTNRGLYLYRQATSYGVLDEGEGISSLASNGLDFVQALGLVGLYIFLNNAFAVKRVRLLLLAPALTYIVVSTFSASRLPMLRMLMAAMVMAIVLQRRIRGVRTYRRAYLYWGLLAVATVVAFVGLRTFVGRGLSATSEEDPVYYFCVYAGGSIPLLDSYLMSPADRSSIFGKETLFSVNRFLGSTLNIPDLVYIKHLEFRRSFNGYNMGNIYTAFRRYLADFGYVGMVLLTVLHATFFSWLHRRVRSKDRRGALDFGLLVLAYLSPSLFLYSIDDRLYPVFLSVNTLKILVMILVSWVILSAGRKPQQDVDGLIPQEAGIGREA